MAAAGAAGSGQVEASAHRPTPATAMMVSGPKASSGRGCPAAA